MRFNPFREFIKKIQRKVPPWVLLGAAVIIVILLVVLIVAIVQPNYNPLNEPSMSSIKNRQILRVGVRDDLEHFSYKEENNTYNGFEDDIARAIAKNIFGDDYLVQFEPVNAATRHVKLKQGMIDCLIAVTPQGYRGKDYLYSVPYYTDAVAVIVNVNSTFENFSQLNDLPIGVLTYPPANSATRFQSASSTLSHEGAGTVLNQFIESGEYTNTIKRYSSIPDMFEALNKNEISAIAIENTLLREYYNPTTMRVLPDAIGLVPYSVVIPTDNEALLEITNKTITNMKKSGEWNALLDKWNLIDYSGK